MQETRGHLFQVTDWKSPEEDIIQLDCEGRTQSNDLLSNALKITRLTLIFNILTQEHRRQLDSAFLAGSIPDGPLLMRLNALKGKYIEIKSVQGILKQ